MKIVLFCHSLASCWNHGNAHFLRGVAWELRERGHTVSIYEPRDSWSLQNLLTDHGDEPVRAFHRAYPGLFTTRYELDTLDLAEALDGAQLVIAHEWSDPQLIARLGEYRAKHATFKLLFHDTHHRSVSDPAAMAQFDLRHYDGALVFGEAIRERYLAEEWSANVWTWHEAADTRLFKPLGRDRDDVDLLWIGNWGDEERTHELQEFLFDPVQSLGLSAAVHGVRYPDHAKAALDTAGIEYRGFIPNYLVPEAFARARMTVHVPRRFYVNELPGIPTIRIFEALACGIPLISAPWSDAEQLFKPGDIQFVANGEQMRRKMRAILDDPAAAAEQADNARATILERHTCGHRVDELMRIYESLAPDAAGVEEPAEANA